MSAQVDVSEPTSASSFGCLVSNGYNFAVVRAYQSNEQPDYNVCPSHKSLHNLQASDSAIHTHTHTHIRAIYHLKPYFRLYSPSSRSQAPGTINAAWAGGISYCDVYMYARLPISNNHHITLHQVPVPHVRQPARPSLIHALQPRQQRPEPRCRPRCVPSNIVPQRPTQSSLPGTYGTVWLDIEGLP